MCRLGVSGVWREHDGLRQQLATGSAPRRRSSSSAPHAASALPSAPRLRDLAADVRQRRCRGLSTGSVLPARAVPQSRGCLSTANVLKRMTSAQRVLGDGLRVGTGGVHDRDAELRRRGCPPNVEPDAVPPTTLSESGAAIRLSGAPRPDTEQDSLRIGGRLDRPRSSSHTRHALLSRHRLAVGVNGAGSTTRDAQWPSGESPYFSSGVVGCAVPILLLPRLRRRPVGIEREGGAVETAEELDLAPALRPACGAARAPSRPDLALADQFRRPSADFADALEVATTGRAGLVVGSNSFSTRIVGCRATSLFGRQRPHALVAVRVSTTKAPPGGARQSGRARRSSSE